MVTAPRGEGEKLAKRLLEKRVAACVNVTSVRSAYWWQGKIEEDNEDLLIIKTSIEKVDALIRTIKSEHPYEVPEVLILPVIACHADYCQWVRSETQGTGSAE
jgi:periplasmic divalent cation tolerance protein